MHSRAETPSEALVAFRMALESAGIRVSAPELADAACAMLVLPVVLDDPKTLRAAMKATLVKRTSEGASFDAVFDAFFRSPLHEPMHRPAHAHDHPSEKAPGIVEIDLEDDQIAVRVDGDGKHEHGERIDLRHYFSESGGKHEHDHHGGNRLRLTWFGQEMHFDQASAPPPGFRQREGMIGLRRVATSGLPGALSLTAQVEIARDVVLEQSRRDDLPASQDPDQDLLGRVEGLLAESVEGGARSVLRTIPERRRMSTETLPDLPWSELTASDLKRLGSTANRLGRIIGGALGRPQRARNGRIDIRATWRSAAQTGGIPFRPVFRTRRDDRPRLIVLCDVSLSVRASAWFMVHLSRAAQRQTGRVKTLVFVRDVADATRLIGNGDAIGAIRTIFGGGLLDVSASSDAGAALNDALRKFGSSFSSKATMVILGDARNNGRDPNTDALRQISERNKRVIWLSPEPRGVWELAGCDLPAYAPHCAWVESVRTPADFERFARRLTSDPKAPCSTRAETIVQSATVQPCAGTTGVARAVHASEEA